MSEILHESDFVSVDIKSMINNYKNNASNVTSSEVAATQEPGTKNTTQETKHTTQEKTATETNNIKWETELKARLEKNKRLGSDAQESDVAIELKFFNDFYTAVWGKALAKNLMQIGEPLRVIFKKMVFDKGDKGVSLASNHIYNFLNLDYVKKELLTTNLINVNTFKGIFNAYALNYFNLDDLLKTNNYNIIYCRDLYKKPAADIVKYFKLQMDILSPKANRKLIGGSTPEAANRKVFLSTEEGAAGDLAKSAEAAAKIDSSRLASMLDTNATLNSLELADAIKNKLLGITKNIAAHLDSKSQKSLADQLNTAQDIFAAIQYFSMTTDSGSAKAAISNSKFKNISAEELVKASLKIKNILPAGRVEKKDADAIVGLLLSKLESIK